MGVAMNAQTLCMLCRWPLIFTILGQVTIDLEQHRFRWQPKRGVRKFAVSTSLSIFAVSRPFCLRLGSPLSLNSWAPYTSRSNIALATFLWLTLMVQPIAKPLTLS
jgi:hypothetical protein